MYFDNVGGDILDNILLLINDYSRIVMCGAVSGYNETSNRKGLKNYSRLIFKKSLMKGFIILDYAKRYKEGI